MMNRFSWTPVFVAVLFALSFAPVFGAEPSGANVTAQDLGSFQGQAPGSVNVQSGNITVATINSTLSTYRWAGLIGNVSGTIVLGDGSNNTLFSWPGGKGLMVYASRNAVTWASLVDADNYSVITNFTFLNDTGSSDNYTATFTGAVENIGSSIFSSLTSDYAQTVSLGGVTTWKTYSLAAEAEIVFAGRVVDDGTAYDGGSVDYQMIIPENGTSGDTTATSWSLYVELT